MEDAKLPYCRNSAEKKIIFFLTFGNVPMQHARLLCSFNWASVIPQDLPLYRFSTFMSSILAVHNRA